MKSPTLYEKSVSITSRQINSSTENMKEQKNLPLFCNEWTSLRESISKDLIENCMAVFNETRQKPLLLQQLKISLFVDSVVKPFSSSVWNSSVNKNSLNQYTLTWMNSTINSLSSTLYDCHCWSELLFLLGHWLTSEATMVNIRHLCSRGIYILMTHGPPHRQKGTQAEASRPTVKHSPTHPENH